MIMDLVVIGFLEAFFITSLTALMSPVIRQTSIQGINIQWDEEFVFNYVFRT